MSSIEWLRIKRLRAPTLKLQRQRAKAKAKSGLLNMYDFVEKMFVPFFNRPWMSNLSRRDNMVTRNISKKSPTACIDLSKTDDFGDLCHKRIRIKHQDPKAKDPPPLIRRTGLSGRTVTPSVFITEKRLPNSSRLSLIGYEARPGAKGCKNLKIKFCFYFLIPWFAYR